MKYLLTVLLIGSMLFAKAQGGYLITLKGDSIFGEIDILRGTYYDEVKVKYDKGKEVYKAFKIKSVIKEGERYEPIIFNNRRIIAKLLTKGTLSYYAIRPEDNDMFTERVFYKNENALVLNSLGFRNRVADFLNDCESLAFKINEKQLGYADIDEILNIYNSRCGSKEETPPIVNSNKELINFSQLLFDITFRLENGEEVPNYMIEALSKYSDVSIDAKIKDLLSTLKKD